MRSCARADTGWTMPEVRTMRAGRRAGGSHAGNRGKAAVERYHDRVAGIYDSMYESDPYWKWYFEITWRHIKRFLPRDISARCIDVGCGTGRWGLKLLKSGYRTDFLDISERMIEHVRKKLEEIRSGHQPRLVRASIDEMPQLESEGWDFVVGEGDPLGCAGNPDRAMKELVRILKPGGVMVMSVDNRIAGVEHYIREGDLDGLESFLRNGRTNWVTDKEEERFEITAFSPSDIREMCAARRVELLSLIGKTVLPLRRRPELLKDPRYRERLTAIEERLHAREDALGLASHLEFAARKPC